MKEDDEQLTVNLKKDLLALFRQQAMKEFTYKRGYMKKATYAAIVLYLQDRDVPIPPGLEKLK